MRHFWRIAESAEYNLFLLIFSPIDILWSLFHDDFHFLEDKLLFFGNLLFIKIIKLYG
jgi:hypothetical protein